MIRQLATLSVFGATAAVLIATSRAPEPCAVETISVLAETTCGPAANVALASTQSCGVTAQGADFVGLPTGGFLEGGVVDGGFDRGFVLRDATQTCSVEPADGGFAIGCAPICGVDGGCPKAACNGTLTPQ